MEEKKKLRGIFLDERFIGNVCLSYRHDYGLMSEEERKLLESQCKQWMIAIINNL